MRNLKIPNLSATTLAITIAGLSGCSLSSHEGDSSIHIDLSALRDSAARFSLTGTGGSFYGLTPPTSAGGFSCYAVNVTGPGIGDSGGGGGKKDDIGLVFPPLWDETSYCSYRGVITPPIQLNAAGSADVALQVPPGGRRLVQVVGIADPLVCASGVVDDPPGSSNSGGGRFFEVGRAKLHDVFSDRSVSVGLNWPATAALQAARAMDCGGNCPLIWDYLSGGTATNYSVTSPSVFLTQAVPYTPNSYLKKISFMLGNSSAPSPMSSTAVVHIFQSTSATAAGATYTGYSSASAVIAPNSALQLVTFDMEDSVNHYLMMQPAYHYWAVVESPDAANSTQYNHLNFQEGSNGTGTASAGVFLGSGTMPSLTFAATTGLDGVYSQMKACSN